MEDYGNVNKILGSDFPWTLIEAYFSKEHLQQLVRHQLESYNDFIERQIPNTINMFNPVIITSEHDYDKASDKYRLEISITFENFGLHRPQIHENNGATKLMFPQEARLRNFTYASNMTVTMNIKYTIRNGENLNDIHTVYKTLPNIHIGKIPIMLKSNVCVLKQYKHVTSEISGECKMDPGGYFIINGSEKTCLGQERAAENTIYCFDIGKNNSKWSYIAEIKSVPDWKSISPKQISITISQKNNGYGYGIYIQIPRIKQPIPLFVLFRALGVISDKDICEKIVLDIDVEINKSYINQLKASIVDGNMYMTQELAHRYITSQVIYTPLNMDKETGQQKKHQFALEVLNNDLFPHCRTREEKLYFLGYMTLRLLNCVNGIIPCDDRDSYVNKRIDLTGVLLNNLFRNYFNKLVKDMQKQIIREINNGSWKSNEDYESIITLTNIYKIVKSTTIENGFKRALATGDFGIKQINSNKVGVAQVLNRLTYLSSLSHLRRVNTPIDKSGKLIPPRKLHNSTWGYLCPAECFDPETPIMMWSGEIKLAKNIIIGDILIDDLGNPTKVRTTCFGVKNMYDIIPDKSNFIKHRVTDNHILTLYIRQHKIIILCNKKDREERYNVKFFNRETNKIQQKSFKSYDEAENYIHSFNDDNTIDITIEDYLKLDNYTKKHLVLYKTNSIKWETKKVEMDPYLLGMWLGDGLSCGTGFALNYKTDFELLDYWKMWAETNEALINKDERYKYKICSKKNKEAYDKGFCNRVEEAPLKKYLKKYNLINNKHIPNDYIVNDKNIRLKLLAGIIDTDGHVRDNGREIRICQGPKNYKIIDDVHKIAISLGFSCNVKEGISQWTDKKTNNKKYSSYKEIRITGNNIHEIPTLLPRKKLHKYTDKTLIMRNNSFMSSPFILKETGVGKYVGWQLEDKKGRFLLDGGLVVHNTPEGGSVGVVKNLSYLSTVTIESDSQPIREYISNSIVKFSQEKNLYKFVKVFLNGSWIGITREPLELYNSLKEKKSKGLINIYTSIVFNYKQKEIIICNDAGRLVRPLLKVKDNKILLTKNIIDRLKQEELDWIDLLTDCKIDNAVLEYIDPREQNSSLVAMTCKDLCKRDSNFKYNYTHCEIHPSTLLGILASCIPFPEHNQAPRLTYQCAMGKQAMGIYVTNFNNRMDKTAYVHTYGMRPLVDTRVMNLLNLHKIPSGAQVIVAIMTHTGYNQEDSILFNKGSIERGLFQATIYHTEKDEDKKIHGDQEVRCKPDPTKTKSMKFANYDKVNDNGVIPENTKIDDRDIVIAKILPIKENRNNHTKVIKYEDQSRIYRTREETYIDKNYIERNGDGYNFAKIRLRTLRQPVIGDKFSSRHGQKGTIGTIIPEENMPFNEDGIRPDIIINPHAIPSRMTIGQLKETLLGKVLLELGLFGDGTSFGEFNIKDICKELQNIGYESKGNEILYDGLSGEQMRTSVFIGPAFYQRLKHMVSDKQHSRSIGPMVNLTRQPAEGRSRDGGLRYGEMEKDAMVAHGASRFNKERLLDASDQFKIQVCKKCGLIAAYNNKEHIHICKTCNNTTEFSNVYLPYACKLLFQELITMNIAPRILTEN
jgi:DNA-directed RNA polymerase beta subunit